ncbi:BAG domain-containing protein Samui-like isoform X2 [Tribolium madens]|uniref:BAG domain-containing protein Samui-like isoform X2 n=1 Tax=Tribolium madens TaxID=41895 RepID=UPI001CF7328A|nr:BAG domain-containing protein Samui-like isoform X2 [Tribolium madens]
MPFPRSHFSGYPFEREDREDPFRSELDDIANRHPEFAEHLGGFPFRSDSLGRRFRQNRPSEEEFRRFGRPFGSRFERFGFPFNRDPFEGDFEEPKPQQQPQPEQKQETHQQQQENPPPERGRKQNIQQSNTVDLGQKQEPVNERNQRSMSAPPPDNRQRYTSSIHIPINREGMADMGAAQSQPQQQQDKPVNKPTERVIPIHVEGRDEPVIPKHTGPTYTQQQQQPQPERIFGHRPSQFTQFVGRESPRPEWHHQGFGPEVRQQQKFQQQAAPPQPQQQKFQQQAAPPQQEVPVQKPQEQVPPPQQPKPSTNPIDIIQSIQKDVSELMSQVEKFNGIPRDKQYLYLDEMLTRNLIKLDNIDTQGQENIRQARKEAIKCIEGCIGILEAKAAANVSQTEQKVGETPETKEESQQAVEEKMEVEVKENEPKIEEKVETKSEPETKEEKMEVASPPAPATDTMEVVTEAPPLVEAPKEKTEEKPKESEPETKPSDEEMKEVSDESKKDEKTEEKKEEASVENKDDINKEKKKEGKKKVVKK